MSSFRSLKSGAIPSQVLGGGQEQRCSLDGATPHHTCCGIVWVVEDNTAEVTPDPDEVIETVLGTVREAEGEQPQTLQLMRVLHGRGVWAYHTEYSPEHRYDLVADTIFAPNNAKFCGRLVRAYTDDKPADVWVIVKGWLEPPPERRIYVEDEDHGLPRMERR